MLSTLARNRITIHRTTNEVIDPITPTTLQDAPVVNIETNVLNTARYKCIISIVCDPVPSDATGSITITGTDASGSSQTEEIFVPISGVGQGLSNFATVSLVTIKGEVLNNRLLTATFLGSDGGSIKARRVLASCQPAQISRGRGGFPAQREGTIQTETIRVLVPYICSSIWQPREGDLLIDDDIANQFIVTGAPMIEQVGMMKYYDLTAKRYQGG